jgi:hypothetical protein
MSNEITMSPISILPVGENKADRQISVVRTATATALTACLSMTGKAGKEIRAQAAHKGLVEIVHDCVNGSYRSLAEMLSIKTGEPVLVSSRSTFEAMPDIYAARVERAKMGKNGGMREDKKTGLMVPGATLKLALELHDEVTRIVRATAEVHARRKAEAEARATEAAKIEG